MFIIFILCPTLPLFAQEEAIFLAKELTSINQNEIDKELHQVFKKQKPNEVDILGPTFLELQVSNEKLKQMIKKDSIKNCQSTATEKKAKVEEKNKDGGWEVVLLVKATNERLQDSQSVKYSDPRNEENRRNYLQLVASRDQEDLENRFQEQIQGMSAEEVLEYISFVGSRLPYDQRRAVGAAGHRESALGLLDILQSEKDFYDGKKTLDEFGGICGDIHFALDELVNLANKQGKMDCDYITMSYQTEGVGHVLGGCANRDGSFLALNYGESRLIKDPNGVASLSPGNAGSLMEDIGNRMRIYGHSEKGAEHIATLKNEVGSFLYAMNLKSSEHSATPIYEDYSAISSDINHNQTKIKQKKNREITKVLNQGVRFYTGTLQGGEDIFGVAVYRESKKTNSKNNLVSTSSNALSLNSVDYSRDHSLDKNPVNIYFLHHVGVEKAIIEKGNFRLAASLSEQIELNAVKTNGKNSFDGDLTFNGKIKSSFQTPDQKTKIQGQVSLDKSLGFRDQRLIADANSYAKNIKFTTNAISLSTYANRSIASDKSIGLGSNVVTTRVGSKYEIYTDYSSGIHKIYVQYENAGKGFGKYDMNLLPNAGEGLEVGHSVQIPFRNNDIQTSTKLTYGPQNNFFSIAAGIKLKINSRKEKD